MSSGLNSSQEKNKKKKQNLPKKVSCLGDVILPVLRDPSVLLVVLDQSLDLGLGERKPSLRGHVVLVEEHVLVDGGSALHKGSDILWDLRQCALVLENTGDAFSAERLNIRNTVFVSKGEPDK